MKRIYRLGCLVRILVVLVLAAAGQSVVVAQVPTGTIRGIVRDQAGTMLAGAEVRAVSASTGLSVPTVISGEGHYGIPELLPGEYEIKVRAKDSRKP